MLKISPNFTECANTAKNSFKHFSKEVHTQRWQGVNIQAKPEMSTFELLNYSIQVPVSTEDIATLQEDIKPNLPWAEDHFLERVCQVPMNPGTEWENWPYNNSADRFREQGKFNHNYLERYWPKIAGKVKTPTNTPQEYIDQLEGSPDPHKGIYHHYGDLMDVVQQLAFEPDTRQAYFPIWFPEDTGVVHKGRVPCSLGYHFIVRDGFMHCVYYLRSCDFVRHFKDDVYLTVRLMLWVIGQCRIINPQVWNNIQPGILTMHITSFHIFKADWQPLFGKG